MPAYSTYLESGILQHIFRNGSFPKPSAIAIALTSGVPVNTQNGMTIPELPTSGVSGVTGYSRLNLGYPPSNGDASWSFNPADMAAGSGVVRNANQLIFNTALLDWGWVSGIAILDNTTVGSGNLLMFTQMNNPRIIYMGDSPKFDPAVLQISLN